MSNKGLLPCPFCGGEAKYDNRDGYVYIVCDECGSRNFGFSEEQAFDEWNSRIITKLTRSDIDKMVKLNFDEYIPEVWMDLSIYGCCFFKLSIYKYGEHYSPYINDERADEAFDTLEEAKDFTKKQVVNFICSSLGIKE